MTSIKFYNGVQLDTTVLDKITAEIKPKASKIIETYGQAMTGQAAKNAPVDTGALKNSITANSKMIETLTFRIQDGVEYGVYQEFGTSKMAAHPWLIPAVESFRKKFLAAFGELFK